MNSKPFTMFLSIAMLSFLLLGCSSSPQPLVLQYEDDDTEVFNSGNMLNFGLILQGADDFYYIDPKEPGEIKRGSDGTTIYSNVGRCFWLFDDEIYCMDEQWANLIRVNVTDGTQKTVVQNRCNDVIVYKGVVFYTLSSEPGLFSKRINEKTSTKIAEEFARNLAVYRDHIYFKVSKTDTIYRLNDYGSIEPFCTIPDVANFLIIEDGIVYRNNENQKLYIWNTSTGTAKNISDSLSLSFNVCGDTVIYTALNSFGQLSTYSYNCLTEETNCLSENGYNGIFIANGQIFSSRSAQRVGTETIERNLMILGTDGHFYRVGEEWA